MNSLSAQTQLSLQNVYNNVDTNYNDENVSLVMPVAVLVSVIAIAACIDYFGELNIVVSRILSVFSSSEKEKTGTNTEQPADKIKEVNIKNINELIKAIKDNGSKLSLEEQAKAKKLQQQKNLQSKIATMFKVDNSSDYKAIIANITTYLNDKSTIYNTQLTNAVTAIETAYNTAYEVSYVVDANATINATKRTAHDNAKLKKKDDNSNLTDIVDATKVLYNALVTKYNDEYVAEKGKYDTAVTAIKTLEGTATSDDTAKKKKEDDIEAEKTKKQTASVALEAEKTKCLDAKAAIAKLTKNNDDFTKAKGKIDDFKAKTELLNASTVDNIVTNIDTIKDFVFTTEEELQTKVIIIDDTTKAKDLLVKIKAEAERTGKTVAEIINELQLNA